MKNIFTIILLFISVIGFSQVQPTGCVQKVNVPALYETRTEQRVLPAVTYQRPITETVTVINYIKDTAIEDYFECSSNGAFKECSRVIKGTERTTTYQVPTGVFETVIVVPSRTIEITHEVKVKDGYIALVPCVN